MLDELRDRIDRAGGYTEFSKEAKPIIARARRDDRSNASNNVLTLLHSQDVLAQARNLLPLLQAQSFTEARPHLSPIDRQSEPAIIRSEKRIIGNGKWNILGNRIDTCNHALDDMVAHQSRLSLKQRRLHKAAAARGSSW